LPYYRFCQIIETINERKNEEKIFQINLTEIIIKQISLYVVNCSMLVKNSKQELIDIIKDFSIIDREEINKNEIKDDKYKDIKPGSFERIMSVFGGNK